MKIIREILGNAVKKYFDVIFEETKSKVDEKIEEIVDKITVLFKETIPIIIYSSIFCTIGILLLVIGFSAYIDQITGYSGSGLMIGGLLLLILGNYYRLKIKRKK